MNEKTANPLVGSLANLIADIVEADGAHPWDDGFCDQLRKDGYTTAGRQRLIEQMRKRARKCSERAQLPVT